MTFGFIGGLDIYLMRDFIHNLYLDLVLKLRDLQSCSPQLQYALRGFSWFLFCRKIEAKDENICEKKLSKMGLLL